MDNPPHPGEFILATFMEPHGLSCRYLAERLDVSPSTLNRILKQQSGVSPEMALRLSKALGRTPQSWLAMQDAYDLWHAGKTIKLDKVHKVELIEEIGSAEEDTSQAVHLLGETLVRQELVGDIGRDVIGLVLGYARTWRLLLDYDEGQLGELAGGQPARGVLNLDEARGALDALAMELKSRGEANELFARDRGEGLAAILGGIEQTMFGEPLYKTREERAAHL